MDMWQVPSYQKYLDDGNSNMLPGRVISNNPDELPQYQCPLCNEYVLAHMLTDVRNLPIGEEWACQNCWSIWLRAGRNIDEGASNPDDTTEWKIRWAQAHGAPTPVLQAASLSRHPAKYLHRRS